MTCVRFYHLLCFSVLMIAVLFQGGELVGGTVDLERAKYLIVMVEGAEPGAGIIVGHHENNLYVVTAYHVVKETAA